jgi:multidrug efflux pump subunit AcrA (membrane-fusion protein)
VFGAASAARSDSPSATTTSRTVTVKQGVVQATVSGSGNLASTKQEDLSFTRAGEITKVYVSEGDHVTEGQALARLDPTDTTVSTRWLRAPYSGTIATVGVAVGDTVDGTDATPALTLVQLTHYEMSVSLSESDIGKVKVGQMATVTVSATGEKLAAHVTAVGVLSSASTDAASTTPSSSSSSTSSSSSSSSSAVSDPVTLRLTQTGKNLKPGMTASADIVTSQSTGLTVPNQALHGSTVTVVSNGTQKTVRVQTGVVADSVTQIVGGLKAGDQVLVTSTSASAGASAASSGAQPATGRAGGVQGGFGGGGGAPPSGAPALGGGRGLGG